MRPDKLVMDSKKIDQPQGTYPYGKNGLWLMNAVQNEPGFRVSSVQIPYTWIGTIETDEHPIVFSTDNTNSAVGFFDETNDVYIPIINDSTLSFKFKFNTAFPIAGEARRNFKNEIEIAWFDRNQSPKFMNTTEIGTTLNDFQLFPQSIPPTVNLTMQSGGNLGMGAYFIAVKYLKKDGTITRYTTLSSPLIANSDLWSTIPGTNTGRALKIELTNLDIRYDSFIIAVVQRLNGVDSAYELPELTISPSATFIYTGSEIETQITLDEVLIPSAFYENIRAMTQLNDQLFMAGITEEEDVEYQKYANLIKVRWKSELATLGPTPYLPTSSGKQRGFMHEEAYALYIVLKLNSGRNSKAFLLIGAAPQGNDLNQSANATAQGLTAAVYQVEDTCRNINISNQSGDCGTWVNQDETYPNTPEFNSTSLGGEDLRNQHIRHFKMPSITFCKDNIYPSVDNYSREQLDTLGLEVSNVQIPPELIDRVVGWEVHYAKRDYNNATVLGQSLLLFGAVANQDMGSKTVITSTGGNWGSYQRSFGHGSNADAESLQPVNDHFRFHAFDMLVDKPAISPTHLSVQMRMTCRMSGGQGRYINRSDVIVIGCDYMNRDNNCDVPIPIAATDRLFAIDGSTYTVNNAVSSIYSNIRLEGCYAGHIIHPGPLLDTWQWMRRDYDRGNNGLVDYEVTYLTNLMTLRRNVYQAFYSQTLVRTGYVFPASLQSSDKIIYGGDTFINDCEFATYGLVNKLDVVDDTGNDGWDTLAPDGIKTFHRFAAEGVSDIATRYVIPGNSYSQFTGPTDPTVNGYLRDFSRNVEPNQIGYTKDCNAVGDLLNGILIASPYDQFVAQSPYKIIRSIKQIREGKTNSWKNYNALDYFETVKNKGEIENLCGMDEVLLIHHKDGLFRTRDKAVLDTDITKITLGSGDIFALDPKEVTPSKLGYAGTRHHLACRLTPIGYIFPDARTGQLFIYDGNKLENLGEGIEQFLINYMILSDANPYTGNGITIGYDYIYDRVLLTVKNLLLTQNIPHFIPGYENTAEFFAKLTANESIVYRNGRYQLFKGENSSDYACTFIPIPSIGNYVFTVDEHIPNNTNIGTVAAMGGTPDYHYMIVAGNTGLAMQIDPTTGIITVQNSDALDYSVQPFILTILVTDSNGQTDTGSVTVNLNHIDSTPKMPAYSKSIPEFSVNGTTIVQCIATDRDHKVPSYSIISGNTGTAFQIDSVTGIITVHDSAQLDSSVNPLFVLTVQVNAGAKVISNTVTVNVTYVLSNHTNDELVTPFTRDNCSAGYAGSIVDYTVPAGLYIADTKADANALATADAADNGQNYANTNGTCTLIPIYHNSLASGLFTRNDCSAGSSGTEVEYTVLANTYSSSISQADADAQAAADIAANGQIYANSHGSCLVDSTLATLTVDFYADTTADLCWYCITPGTDEENIICTAPENGGPARYPNDGRDPATCYLLSSNRLPSGPVAMRFAINVAYFIAKYPGITDLAFRMRGRGAVTQTVTGVYALRDITGGHLIMPEFSPGIYIPSVSSGAPTVTGYSSNIVNGGDGTVGVTVGSPILDLSIHVPSGLSGITATTY